MRDYFQKYKITDKQLAEYLGYTSAKAFYNSSARKRIRKGINKLLQYIDELNKEV